MAFHRVLAEVVNKNPFYSQGFESFSVGEEVVEGFAEIAAPAIGAILPLPESPVAEGTLDIARISDAAFYAEGADFSVAATLDAWTNLAIPQGTPIRLEYAVDTDYTAENLGFDPVEPVRPLSLATGWTPLVGQSATLYRDRERVYLGGAITGGSVLIGDPLLTVPEDCRPDSLTYLSLYTDAGMALVEVDALGVARWSEYNYAVPGNGAVILEGASYRAAQILLTQDALYPDEDLYPSEELLPYGEDE